MSKTKRLICLGIIVAVAFAAMFLLGHNSRSLRALRNYQALLRARGEKLSYAELIADRKGFTNHSLSLITNTIRRVVDGSALTPGALEMMKFTGPGGASAAWRADRPP